MEHSMQLSSAAEDGEPKAKKSKDVPDVRFCSEICSDGNYNCTITIISKLRRALSIRIQYNTMRVFSAPPIQKSRPGGITTVIECA